MQRSRKKKDCKICLSSKLKKEIKGQVLYRTRYFTDSGVIGTKEFVSRTYVRFKHHFNSKNEKKPKPVKGLSGIYSLKRLSEVYF